MNTAIEVNNLTKHYGDLLAVDHIDFDVYQGEVFGFLGPSLEDVFLEITGQEIGAVRHETPAPAGRQRMNGGQS